MYTEDQVADMLQVSLLEVGARALHVFSDSEVVVKQMTGEYTCRSSRLYSLHWTCRKLARSLEFSDADTRAWRSPKGIRDLAAGLVVLTMMVTADTRLVGIALLVEAIIPLGDMSIILGSGGSKSRAFSIHGVTCAVMLVVGLLLIHAL